MDPSFRSVFCHRKPSIGHVWLFYMFHSFVSLLRCYGQKSLVIVFNDIAHPLCICTCSLIPFVLLLFFGYALGVLTVICRVFSSHCLPHCISDSCTTSKLLMFGCSPNYPREQLCMNLLRGHPGYEPFHEYSFNPV